MRTPTLDSFHHEGGQWFERSGVDYLVDPRIDDDICVSGITLDQYYVLPTCSPSRATFLTGRLADTFVVLAVSRADKEICPGLQ